MRYTVRNRWFVTLLLAFILLIIIAFPASALYDYYLKKLPVDKRFYLDLALVVIPIVAFIIFSLPKVLVFDDYAYIRRFLVYTRHPYTELTHFETVEKEMDFSDGFGAIPYKETIFYKNGKKLFKMDPNAKNAQQFLFDCRQKQLKAHLNVPQ